MHKTQRVVSAVSRKESPDPNFGMSLPCFVCGVKIPYFDPTRVEVIEGKIYSLDARPLGAVGGRIYHRSHLPGFKVAPQRRAASVGGSVQ